jgi:hypothetical protein
MRINTVFGRCAELLPKDPRYYQIAVLFSLLLYGVGRLGFDIDGHDIAILLGTVIVAQFLCTKIFPGSMFDCRSADLRSLSLLIAANQRFNSDDPYSRDYDCQQILTSVER